MARRGRTGGDASHSRAGLNDSEMRLCGVRTAVRRDRVRRGGRRRGEPELTERTAARCSHADGDDAKMRLAAMPALDFASANAGGTTATYELVFVINLYWPRKQLLRNGERIASRPFKAGGCSWSFH